MMMAGSSKVGVERWLNVAWTEHALNKQQLGPVMDSLLPDGQVVAQFMLSIVAIFY